MAKVIDDSILPRLRELEVGESLTCPARRASYLQSICSRFAFEWGVKFTTAVDRKARTITATRTA